MSQWVTGDQTSGGTEPGTAPVKIGGVNRTTLPTFTDGQRGDVQIGTRGSLQVTLFAPNSANSIATPANLADAVSGSQALPVGTYLYNNAAFDRQRTASAANLALQSGLGVAMHSLPGQWGIVHLPATNTQATISKSAVAATRHVATAVTATLASGSTAITVPATPVNVVIRDGATGAGTIIWQSYISAVTTAGSMATVQASGLNLVGTANTAMTVEFSAAGGVGTFESVSLQGFSVA